MTALCQQFFIVDPVQDDVQTVVQIEEERGGPAEAVEEARCSPGLLGVFREPGDVGEDVADADDEMVLLGERGQYFGQIGGNGAVLIRVQQTDQRELVGEKRPVGELAGQLRKQDLGIEIWRPGISGADGEHPHVLAEFQTADFGTQSRLCRRGGCSDVSHRIGGV